MRSIVRELAKLAVAEFLAETQGAAVPSAEPPARRATSRTAERWLSAEECAAHLGLRPTRSGRPNRRGFLERIAAHPNFPRGLVLPGSKEKVWKLSEVDEWAEEERRAQSR